MHRRLAFSFSVFSVCASGLLLNAAEPKSVRKNVKPLTGTGISRAVDSAGPAAATASRKASGVPATAASRDRLLPSSSPPASRLAAPVVRSGDPVLSKGDRAPAMDPPVPVRVPRARSLEGASIGRSPQVGPQTSNVLPKIEASSSTSTKAASPKK